MSDDDIKVRASLEDDLTGPLEDVQDEVRKTAREVRQLDRRALSGSNALGKLARSGIGLARSVGRGLFTAAKMGAAGIGLIAVAAVAAGGKLVNLASDAAETASKFATVFQGNSDAVSKWVKETNRAYGITTKDLQDVTSRFGVFGKAAGVAPKDLQGFSTSLAQAGLDLSSFYNVDPEEAFLALSSGLAGEAEPLRRFGIFLSDATMKAEAASMGLTGELTEAQKVMVRQRLILKSLGDANGDLARTKDSVANKARALKGRLTELATQIGTVLLPVAGRLLTWLDNKIAPAVSKLTDQAPKLATALGDVFDHGDWQGVAEVVDNIAGNTGRWIDPILRVGAAIDRVRTGLPHLGATLSNVTKAGDWTGVARVVDGMLGGTGRWVGPLTTAGNTLQGVFDKAKQVGADLLTIWREGVVPALEELGPAATLAENPLRALDDVIGFIADNITTLRPLVTALVAGYVAYSAATTVAAAAQWALNTATEANPYVLAATAIAAVAIGVWQLWKHCKAARPIIVAVGIALTAAFPGGFFLLFIAGLVTAYKKVGWFRDAVNTVGRAIRTGLGAAFRWIGSVASSVADGIRTGWGYVQTAIAAVKPYVDDVGRVLRVVAAISFAPLIIAVAGVIATVRALWERSEPVRSLLATIARIGFAALRAGLSWLVDRMADLYEASEPVRSIIGTIAGIAFTGLKNALRWIGDKLGTIAEKASGLVDTIKGLPGVSTALSVAGIGGDTPRPHGRRRGGHGAGRNLSATMAAHRRIDRGVPGSRRVTSSYRTWALGSPGSDHATGRAIDLTGSNLNTYARKVREAGGFAEHHGSGAGRHLHAVPAGDTPRARYHDGAAGTGGDGGTLIVFEDGAIRIDGTGLTPEELEAAIAAAVARYDRDRRERGARTR